jgi:hypothetical protein
MEQEPPNAENREIEGSRAEPTSFPGLQCEDEARHEEALVWAGHVTTKNGSI